MTDLCCFQDKVPLTILTVTNPERNSSKFYSSYSTKLSEFW